LIDELRFYARRLQRLVAYTIMPDHLHLIVEIGEASSLSGFLHHFKSYTSKEIKKKLAESSRRLPAVGPCHNETPTGRHLLQRMPTSGRLLPGARIWQPGTMDHCIRMSWDNNDYGNHLAYLFYNSQKHLGIAPKDFPYHNFQELVGTGFLDEDFCSMSEKVDRMFAIYE
jgi:REP element-mobilizing transposase RayT